MAKYLYLRLIFICFILGWYSCDSSAQKTDPGIDALLELNTSYLLQHSENTMNVSIDQNNKMDDKKTAIQSVINFMRERSFSKYTIRHRGNSADGAQHYIIANLSSVQGTYRLFLHYSYQSKRIKEIRLIKP